MPFGPLEPRAQIGIVAGFNLGLDRFQGLPGKPRQVVAFAGGVGQRAEQRDQVVAILELDRRLLGRHPPPP